MLSVIRQDIEAGRDRGAMAVVTRELDMLGAFGPGGWFRQDLANSTPAMAYDRVLDEIQLGDVSADETRAAILTASQGNDFGSLYLLFRWLQGHMRRVAVSAVPLHDWDRAGGWECGTARTALDLDVGTVYLADDASASQSIEVLPFLYGVHVLCPCGRGTRLERAVNSFYQRRIAPIVIGHG